MKKLQKYLIIINLCLIIGIILYFSLFRKKPIPSQPIYNYITDTIHDSIPYPIPIPYLITTPPRIVTEYLVDSVAIDSLKLLMTQDSIIIAGLKSQILIHQNYLKQFPRNPKLLSLDLKRDSLVLGLLQISGIPEKDKWPIDLNLYSYRWDFNNNFTRTDITQLPPTRQRLNLQYFVGGGVDLLYLSPYVSGRIEQEWTRIRLYGNAQVGLLKKESSTLEIGAEYKINVKSIR